MLLESPCLNTVRDGGNDGLKHTDDYDDEPSHGDRVDMALPPAPPRNIPRGGGRWILVLALLTLLGAIVTGFGRSGPWLRPRLRLAVLLVAIVLVALGVGCENYVNPINISPAGDWDTLWHLWHCADRNPGKRQQRYADNHGEPIGSTQHLTATLAGPRRAGVGRSTS